MDSTPYSGKMVAGDLIDIALHGGLDVIVHGCNCFNNMGAGIAKTIKEIFPEAYEVDCRTRKGDRNKLGTISVAEVERNGHRISIVNAYTQYGYGRNQIHADYEAIRKAMEEVKTRFQGCRIGYPKIGAGHAQGDWLVIEPIIQETLAGENHTLVLYKPTATTKPRAMR